MCCPLPMTDIQWVRFVPRIIQARIKTRLQWRWFELAKPHASISQENCTEGGQVTSQTVCLNGTPIGTNRCNTMKWRGSSHYYKMSGSSPASQASVCRALRTDALAFSRYNGLGQRRLKPRICLCLFPWLSIARWHGWVLTVIAKNGTLHAKLSVSYHKNGLSLVPWK